MIALTLMCQGRKRVQIAAPGKGGGLGSAPYCPIRIDFQDQYYHRETGEDRTEGVKEEKREGKMGWGRRQGKEKKEEGREESKLSYKRGRIGCEEDFCCCSQSGNKRKRR